MTEEMKERWDEIPYEGLVRLARVYALGNEKHKQNWRERNVSIEYDLNKAIRHIYKFLSGSKEEDNIAHACWRLMAVMYEQNKILPLEESFGYKILEGPKCKLEE